MSTPADIEIIKNLEKPFLKYKIGQTVFLKTDTEHMYPMMIVNYELDDYNCNDYEVRWLNGQSKPEYESFPQECLIEKSKSRRL
ncbi:MAG: hypothetical protein K0B11_16510 [Mariniphaga sp.]|nr:hypothetical protein [Mariniphaga sp.]